MATQTRVPTGIGVGDAWTLTAGSDKVDAVDDPVGTPDDDTTRIFSTTNNQAQRYTFSPFAIDSSAIAFVRVFNRCRNASATALCRESIRVNGTNYQGANYSLSGGSYVDESNDWTDNPNTALPWVEADVEGTGSNPLQQCGIQSRDVDDKWCTQIYVLVSYTEAGGANPKGPLGHPLHGALGGPV